MSSPKKIGEAREIATRVSVTETFKDLTSVAEKTDAWKEANLDRVMERMKTALDTIKQDSNDDDLRKLESVCSAGKVVFELAGSVCPSPFDTVFGVIGSICEFALGCIANRSECLELADRVMSLYPILVAIHRRKKRSGDPFHKSFERFVAAINEAQALVEKFVPPAKPKDSDEEEASWFSKVTTFFSDVKATVTSVTMKAGEFLLVHSKIDRAIQDQTLAETQLTRDDIRYLTRITLAEREKNLNVRNESKTNMEMEALKKFAQEALDAVKDSNTVTQGMLKEFLQDQMVGLSRLEAKLDSALQDLSFYKDFIRSMVKPEDKQVLFNGIALLLDQVHGGSIAKAYLEEIETLAKECLHDDSLHISDVENELQRLLSVKVQHRLDDIHKKHGRGKELTLAQFKALLTELGFSDQKLSELKEQPAEKLFARYDLDRSGTLSIFELRSAMDMIYLRSSPPKPKWEAKLIGEKKKPVSDNEGAAAPTPLTITDNEMEWMDVLMTMEMEKAEHVSRNGEIFSKARVAAKALDEQKDSEANRGVALWALGLTLHRNNAMNKRDPLASRETFIDCDDRMLNALLCFVEFAHLDKEALSEISESNPGLLYMGDVYFYIAEQMTSKNVIALEGRGFTKIEMYLHAIASEELSNEVRCIVWWNLFVLLFNTSDDEDRSAGRVYFHHQGKGYTLVSTLVKALEHGSVTSSAFLLLGVLLSLDPSRNSATSAPSVAFQSDYGKAKTSLQAIACKKDDRVELPARQCFLFAVQLSPNAAEKARSLYFLSQALTDQETIALVAGEEPRDRLHCLREALKIVKSTSDVLLEAHICLSLWSALHTSVTKADDKGEQSMRLLVRACLLTRDVHTILHREASTRLERECKKMSPSIALEAALEKYAN